MRWPHLQVRDPLDCRRGDPVIQVSGAVLIISIYKVNDISVTLHSAGLVRRLGRDQSYAVGT